eukprot:scaffold307670_cov26-Tisochrysis_lutea.AAC.1
MHARRTGGECRRSSPLHKDGLQEHANAGKAPAPWMAISGCPANGKRGAHEYFSTPESDLAHSSPQRGQKSLVR